MLNDVTALGLNLESDMQTYIYSRGGEQKKGEGKSEERGTDGGLFYPSTKVIKIAI